MVGYGPEGLRPFACEVDAQAPHRVHAEAWAQSHLRPNKEGRGVILRRLCEYKGIKIVEGHLMPDHAHMLVEISPEVLDFERDGAPEGKELAHGLRPTCEPEVQVRQQEVLGGGLLRVDRRA